MKLGRGHILLARVLAAALVSGLFVAAATLSLHREGDIDRYYHFAISRFIVETGLPWKLPQVENLGWAKAFPEKEFLFHQVTAVGYFFAKEEGVIYAALALAVVSIGVLSVFTASRIGVIAAFLLVSVCLLAEPYFAFRLMLVRPHVLAIALFIGAVYATIARRPFLAGGCGFLFSLAYHAFYLPLAVFALGYLTGAVCKDSLLRKCSLAVAIGVLAGLCINPYFPLSIGIASEHLVMALNPPQDIPHYFVGSELLRPQWQQILEVFYPHLVLLCAALIALFQRCRQTTAKAIGLELWCVFTAIGLFLLGKSSPRAFEYAVPMTVFAAALSLSTAGRWLKIATAIAVIISLSVKTPAALNSYVVDTKNPVALRANAAAMALATVPRAEIAGKKIFNCHWDLGSLILYAQPEARFVDLLDPRLLYFLDPKLAKLRIAIFDGRVKNAVEVIRGIFKADYILCAAPGLHEQLESSPNVQRIFPIDSVLPKPEYTPGLRPALYKVVPAVESPQ